MSCSIQCIFLKISCKQGLPGILLIFLPVPFFILPRASIIVVLWYHISFSVKNPLYYLSYSFTDIFYLVALSHLWECIFVCRLLQYMKNCKIPESHSYVWLFQDNVHIIFGMWRTVMLTYHPGNTVQFFFLLGCRIISEKIEIMR